MNEDRYYSYLEAKNDDATYCTLEEQAEYERDRAHELKKAIDNNLNDSNSDETINAFVLCDGAWSDLVDATPELEFDLISKQDKDHMAYRAWKLMKEMEAILEKSLEGSL